MRVNNKVYDVYPDLISLTRDPVPATKYKKEIAKIENLNNSIPIARQVILRDYYSHLVASLKAGATTGGKITQAKMQAAIETSIKQYAAAVKNDTARIE